MGISKLFNMKTRLLFITTLLLLQGQVLFSQCISIELSVTWTMGYDIFNKDSTISIPILNITYRNNCNEDYYFLKACYTRDNLPNFFCTILYYPSNENYDCHKVMQYNAKMFENQSFNVIMGGQYYSRFWEVYCDTIDVAKPHYPHDVNCSLIALNECIRLDNESDYLKMIKQGVIKDKFEPSDVLPENILGSVKERFVFLKSGETNIDTYNLVSFQIVEGCYTFFIDQDDLKNYLTTQEYDFNLKKLFNQKLELPAIVGEYQLYSGAFNTNKVTVCFGKR